MNGKLAIFSPSSDAYSETFIQSHRGLNGGNVAFYYGGLGEIKLDGEGRVQSDFMKALWRLWGKLIGKSKLDIRKSLEKSFKKHKVSDLLIEYGTLGADVLPYLNFFKGKIIVHFHGFDAASYSVLEKYEEAYGNLFERADRIVVVSEKMKTMLMNIGAPESKLVLNTYGPHPDFFKVTPNYSSKQLVYVGRLVDKKAPYYMVLLMAELITVIPDVKLLIIGNGPLYQTMRDLIAYFNLHDNVFLKGRQTRAEIISIFSESTCCLQHSVRAMDGDMEGAPNSILEASASGLPVVSTYHAGIPDVVLDGITGVLVEEHDIKGMIKAVAELIDDPKKKRELGEAARDRIKANFTQERYLNKLDELFN